MALTSLLTIVSPDLEALPRYSRDDTDGSSIRSAAPSYISDTPTYNSYRTPTSLLPPLSPEQRQTCGLPSPQFAPGFRNRPTSSTLNVATQTSNNLRQYNAVARRRAYQARADTTALLNCLSAVPPPLERPGRLSPPLCRPCLASPNSHTPADPDATASDEPLADSVEALSEPLHPLEDPRLVGEEAAHRARERRKYIESCLRDEDAAMQESRGWEFMLGQMADWEERARSWGTYREGVGKRKGLRWRLCR